MQPGTRQRHRLGWGRSGLGVEVQVLPQMCRLRCTLDSQMELSAGREIYESGDVMQTQKVIFIVLIQRGNANHTEEKPVHHLTAGTIYFTHSICGSVGPGLCLTPASTTRMPAAPLGAPGPGKSEQQAQATSSLSPPAVFPPGPGQGL